MLSIPLHTSHRLQPLDICFCGPLKWAYDRGCDLFLKSHPLQKITNYEIAELFNKAYERVAAIEKAVKGFSTAGIYPLDPNIFDGDYPDFADQLENEPQPSTSNDTLDTHTAVSLNDHSSQEPLTSEVNHEPSTSKIQTAEPMIQLLNVSLHEIAPLPRATDISKSNKKQGRRKQKSEILT
ncbi:hypothetical protein JTB14_034202 [Gonioctena quinquepunctata]|nr:hypothetical protein JTB14_034202 [Gonioctena quinquepunctata]